MAEIPITQGHIVIVDDDDYEWLVDRKWCCLKTPYNIYAVTRDGTRPVLMHRLILNAPDHMQVDHKNFDGLDNRRDNLRLATPLQNTKHRRKFPNTESGYKGVYRDKRKWIAAIWNDGKRIKLGRFTFAEEAALAYDLAAARMFGEFAVTNFPLD